MMQLRQTQKVISIDSSSRSSGTPSNFDVSVDMPQSNAFNKASCMMAEIPKSYYTLPDQTITANRLRIYLSSTAIGTVLVGAIDGARMHDASTFAAALSTELTVLIATLSCAYDTTLGKIVFTDTALDFDIQITQTGAVADWVEDLAAKYTGFNLGTLYSATLTGGTTHVLIPPNMSNVQRYDALYVTSSVTSNNNDDVLITIYPSKFPNLSLISYTAPDTDSNSVNVTNSNTNNIHFTLRDRYGIPVDLNGVDMRLVVTFYNE